MKTHSSVFVVLRLLIASIALPGCSVIRPGEVGVKQRFGKLNDRVHPSGMVAINPFITRMIKIPTRTVNL